MDKDFISYSEIAEMLKVLAHPVRICIVKGLMEKGQCNVGHMQTCMELPQSTLSQHLQKLRAAGILESFRNGLEVYYKINDDRVVKIINVLFNSESEK